MLYRRELQRVHHLPMRIENKGSSQETCLLYTTEVKHLIKRQTLHLFWQHALKTGYNFPALPLQRHDRLHHL